MFKKFLKQFLKKKTFGWSAVVILLIVLSVYQFTWQTAPLIVNFLDIGQGDSTLITMPNHQVILIDGGPDNSVLYRLGTILPFYRRKIDLMIFSHYHRDHIIGLIEVLKRYQVEKIIYAPSKFSSLTLQVLLATVKKQKIPTVLINSTAQLNFSPNCSLSFLNVDSLEVKKAQNNSLVVKLNCQHRKFLFTGDNSATVEKALVNSGWDLTADVLKAAHHGSRTANSEEFLQVVQPRFVSISVGVKNHFGHPSPAILERLSRLHIKFKRTDQSGSIQIVVPDSP